MKFVEDFYQEKRQQKVKTISRILNGDFASAEDVVQEAFTRALTFYPSYDHNRGTVDKWFNSIMFNALHDFQKNEKGIVHDSVTDISLEDVIDTKALAQSKKVRALLSELIRHTVNPIHKRVLELFFIMGYTSKEISQIELKMSQTNVTTIVMRFKDSLKERGFVI